MVHPRCSKVFIWYYHIIVSMTHSSDNVGVWMTTLENLRQELSVRHAAENVRLIPIDSTWSTIFIFSYATVPIGDAWIARYRSITSRTYEPPPSPRPPLFGGTPLTEGDFRIEEERHLPIALKVVRWSALAWAVFILFREWYHVLERID